MAEETIEKRLQEVIDKVAVLAEVAREEVLQETLLKAERVREENKELVQKHRGESPEKTRSPMAEP